MKNIFKNKKINIVLALLTGAMIGALSVQFYKKQDKNDDLTPFYVKMLELQAKEVRKMAELAKNIEESVEGSVKDVGKANYYASVDRETNDKEISYKLNFTGYDQNDIDIKVENDTIMFRAVKEVESPNQYLGSRFSYSFSIPEYDKSKQPEITKNKDNIVVKFFKNS